MATSVWAFIVVLGILIFAHELGHFLVARFFGVGVEKFSLGFGPRLVGKTVGRTDYRISAIPLGGYVKMVGEEPDAEIDPADIPVSFTHKPVSKRFCIVAAGPAFNVVLAALIFFGIFWINGLYILKPTVGNVQTDSAAAAAGLQKADTVLAVDGVAVSAWEQMAKAIADSQGRPLRLRVLRGQSELELTVVPEPRIVKNIFGEDTRRYVIGISSSGEAFSRSLTFVEALVESVAQTWKVGELTVVSLAKVVVGSVSVKTLGGPLMIAEMAGEQAREGMVNLFFFIALISINLAILNILPIPVLDGGHLVFFAIEAVMGRPVSLKVREVAQQTGVFLLLLLMAFVFYNDISRIFFQ